MECKKEKNLERCNCTTEPCSRKGICCECIEHHLKMRKLPACCFPGDEEKSHNRSFEHFAELVSKGRI
ncbi:MAG TPA: DUF6485 family protein [Desulfomonilia bacterium]